jgi:hypothetical protein
MIEVNDDDDLMIWWLDDDDARSPFRWKISFLLFGRFVKRERERDFIPCLTVDPWFWFSYSSWPIEDHMHYIDYQTEMHSSVIEASFEKTSYGRSLNIGVKTGFMHLRFGTQRAPSPFRWVCWSTITASIVFYRSIDLFLQSSKNTDKSIIGFFVSFFSFTGWSSLIFFYNRPIEQTKKSKKGLEAGVFKRKWCCVLY